MCVLFCTRCLVGLFGWGGWCETLWTRWSPTTGRCISSEVIFCDSIGISISHLHPLNGLSKHFNAIQKKYCDPVMADTHTAYTHFTSVRMMHRTINEKTETTTCGCSARRAEMKIQVYHIAVLPAYLVHPTQTTAHTHTNTVTLICITIVKVHNLCVFLCQFRFQSFQFVCQSKWKPTNHNNSNKRNNKNNTTDHLIYIALIDYVILANSTPYAFVLFRASAVHQQHTHTHTQPI